MQARTKLEEERQALAAFVKKFDSLGLGGPVMPMPAPGGAAAIFAQRQKSKVNALKAEHVMAPVAESESPIRLGGEHAQPSLLEEEWDGGEDVSIELEKTALSISPPKSPLISRKGAQSPVREVLGQKENVPV